MNNRFLAASQAIPAVAHALSWTLQLPGSVQLPVQSADRSNTECVKI